MLSTTDKNKCVPTIEFIHLIYRKHLHACPMEKSNMVLYVPKVLNWINPGV